MRRSGPSRSSCHALILFGFLVTVIGLDGEWRNYSGTPASGWDAVGGRDSVLVLIMVLASLYVAWDSLISLSPRPTADSIVCGAIGGVLLVGLVLLAIAVGDQGPDVFDGSLSDEGPQGPAFLALGGWLFALAGWVGMFASGRSAEQR